MAGSASLSLSSATENTATIQYSASGFSLPSGSTGSWSGGRPTDSKTDISYKDISYSWSFGASGRTGSYTSGGLTAGSSNQIFATVTVSCTRVVTNYTQNYTREWIDEVTDDEGKVVTPGHWGSWQASGGVSSSSSQSSYSLGSASASLTVYTKPSTFAWGAGVAKGQTIQQSSGLSASKWNELVTKTEQRRNWINQSGTASYSTLKVKSGDLVTASLYNRMAQACDCSTRVSNDQDKNDSIIYASVFQDLANAVNN